MAKTRHNDTSPTPMKKKAKEKEVVHQDINNSGSVAPIQHICRTCLEEIQASSLIPLNDSSSNIRNELRACIPELDFDLVPNAGMCTYCLNALHVAYEFKQKCLQTEDKIRKQLHRKLLVDLTKLKKTNNMVQVSNGGGLGLDVVYINDAIEIIDCDVEAVNPFVSPPKSQISTPLLDEEIEMINSSANMNNDDENMSASSISIDEEEEEIIPPNKYLCNDDEPMDEEDISVPKEMNGNNKKGELNILLGVSESAPRKLSTNKKIADKNKDKTDDITDTSLKTTNVVETNSSKSQNGLFACVTCSESFDELDEYAAHTKQHRPKIFKCNGCSFQTKTFTGFMTHMKLCRKSKALISKMSAMKKAGMKQQPYKCTVCNFTTPVQLIFKKHVQMCSNTTTKTNKQLKSKVNNVKLKLNVSTTSSAKEKGVVAKDTPQSKKVKSSSKVEPTPSPTTSTTTFEAVNAVVSKLFSDINKHECRLCDYIVYDSNEFETHVSMLHKTEFPYSCKDRKCHFLARNKTGLVAHMIQHYGDRPYRCDICSYQCLNSGALQMHTKRHKTQPKVAGASGSITKKKQTLKKTKKQWKRSY